MTAKRMTIQATDAKLGDVLLDPQGQPAGRVVASFLVSSGIVLVLADAPDGWTSVWYAAGKWCDVMREEEGGGEGSK